MNDLQQNEKNDSCRDILWTMSSSAVLLSVLGNSGLIFSTLVFSIIEF